MWFRVKLQSLSGDIALEDVEKNQGKLKAELGRIKQGDPKDKSKDQIEVINNVINLYESREKVVQMFNNYPREKSNAKWIQSL